MLVGAGAVGLELAGEIASAWPGKQVTLVDLADEILPGPYAAELRDELNRQLDELGVRRVLGSPLSKLPATPPGETGSFSVHTDAGTQIEADLWLQCHSVVPATGYLTGGLAKARSSEGYVEVSPELRVTGFSNVYAIGDIASIDINRAAVAGRQAEVVVANILAQIAGSDERSSYAPAPGTILLPLGPSGGSGQIAGQEGLLSRETVAGYKGRDLLVGRYAELFGVTTG
jgi:NADH dehydrogenase FAD-containing subunit